MAPRAQLPLAPGIFRTASPSSCTFQGRCQSREAFATEAEEVGFELPTRFVEVPTARLQSRARSQAGNKREWVGIRPACPFSCSLNPVNIPSVDFPAAGSLFNKECL